VPKCIKLMEICANTLKICNDTMTIVADNVDNDATDESHIVECRIWVNRLVALSDNIDDAIINLGAELYAPILDINEVESNYYHVLYTQLCTMKDLVSVNDNVLMQKYMYYNHTETKTSNNNDSILLLESIIQQINSLV